jgi:hypothetical protein
MDRWTVTDDGVAAGTATADIAAVVVDKVELAAMRLATSTWIGSADIKATALLAVAGALLAAVAFASGGSPTCLERLFVLLFCLCAVASIGASAAVMWPRTNRSAVLGTGAISRLPHSPSYFGEMGSLCYDEFVATLGRVTSITLLDDLREQTYVAMVIARAKMIWMRRAVFLLLCSLVLLSVFVLIHGFGASAVNGRDPGSHGAATGQMNPTLLHEPSDRISVEHGSAVPSAVGNAHSPPPAGSR